VKTELKALPMCIVKDDESPCGEAADMRRKIRELREKLAQEKTPPRASA
jgi:hypothetical protein